MAMSLGVYNPVTGQVHNAVRFHLTPTGRSFLGTALLYTGLSRTPPLRR